MNIGIVIYSQTGNTLAVSQRISERLHEAGHSTGIERLTVEGGEAPGAGDTEFSSLPSIEGYDALILGAPVHAFSLAPAMASYLAQLPPFKDVQVACFVTKRLPFNWTGGNRAVGEMKRICESKAATVCATEIVVWSGSQREQSIRRCVDRLASCFPAEGSKMQ